MNRRFVNLVTRNWAEGVYSVRRIDPSHLFYRSAKTALEAADEAAKKKEYFPAMQTLQLPIPTMNFTTTPSGGRLNIFTLLSTRATCEGRMVFANSIGEVVLYDADKQLLNTMGHLNQPKGINPMCVSIAHPGTDQDSLYVMDIYPGKAADRCFEVLEYMPTCIELNDLMATWRWRLLPPPPFVLQPGYEPSTITSYTSIVNSYGCSTIYISCEGDIGTYSFETARHDSRHRLGWRHSEEWKHVGKWKLPFNGGAQYVPEFNLWFGFSASRPNYLCAADLSDIVKDGQPTERQVWQDLNPPEGEVWLPIKLKLLNMGDGKFLIAKTLEEEATGERFAVLSGVEIMHGSGDGQSLQMVKHKCAYYTFTNDTIYWVL
ncbi:uncharacterized protein LOC104581408 [Brachypodium distachyon]|uniref:DUF1618 domain-containing protein n=1 Tax=Brachypodium distachyon TaxID=15368 RepID=A0A0Q3GS18_BRADI|nr:uncharacterized protein LOC104581408 [Brachypodium distachyon]KQJ83794.1 hypothetical protein BRADI_5g16893v3 [Brachypodium distachyon]|eukprot:XP_010227211.1 uncharacterized protein LOC104581408 [Brachypodium distachyon]